MSQKTDKQAFHKSLDRLGEIVKSQLFHTGSDSQPGTWAGSTPEDIDEVDSAVNIDDNGTDYNGVKKALAAKVAKSQALTPAEVLIIKGQDPRKAIADKVSKGQNLTPAELWVLKGGFDQISKAEDDKKPQEVADAPSTNDDYESAPETNAAAKEKDVEDAKKSLSDAARDLPSMQKGLEVSSFLYEFTKAMDQALTGLEARVSHRVSKSLEPVAQRLSQLEKSKNAKDSEQGEFFKSLAEAVVGIGQQVSGMSELQTQAAQAPVGGPRGVHAPSNAQGVQVIQKAFGGQSANGLDSLQKSQLVDVMCEMVKSQKLNAAEVIKFETSGELSQGVRQQVSAFLQGK